MQLQIGKRRRALEEAFDHRTAELRVLSEREFTSPRPARSGIDDKQRPLSVSSDVNQTVQRHLLIRHGEHSPLVIYACDFEHVRLINLTRYEMSGYPSTNEVSNWVDWIEPAYRDHVTAMWDRVYGEDPQPMETAEWKFTNGRWGESRRTQSVGEMR